ncbi:hypothetical protein OU994_14370 [Pseudoduganella sp. SL102]|uniref:hypothetical protein n=1 Tax=Pseudoduganella sp. SL102 TaxID=2995154 RepID=UPI00248BC0DC|nr:hypothetical protein [Pseudoduganella sp. SL102]WBS05374.1 hypothetical protein OU994_14370 [Pseudoduganella sp. SL102]
MSSDNVIENDPVEGSAGLRSEKAGVHPNRVAERQVNELPAGQGAPSPALSGTGFTYRHDWGPRRGQWTLRLNWPAVGPQSHVFVSIGEGAAGGPDAGKFLGAARYTLHNVAPRPGGVDIWVNVEWGADIPLYVDYLVVNPPTLGTRTVSVTVHRHSAVALTDAEADRILRDMGTVLQGADTGADIATRVQFVRNGPVRLLPATVPATIQTQAEWNTLMGAGTGIKVVQAIRWCGGPGGSIIGCAPVGSAVTNLAVVRFTANQEGILWVHEYGHNAGNGHRSDDTRAVMFPSIGADHNVVDATESGRYLAGPLAGTGAVMAAGGCSCQGPVARPPADVRAFVSQHWIEGIPYGAASQYQADDARKLLEWLVDEPEQHEEFLPEIVTTLCFIGSEIAVRPLIDFVESRRAGQAVFNAKNAALIHLGDLVNASGSRAALDFLMGVASDMEKAKSLASPQAAMAAVDATIAGAAVPTVEALGAELAVSATFGLSLAGQPEAEQALGRLRSHPDAYASVSLAAVEAAELARTVRARGQKEYYRMKAEHGSAR